MGRVKNGKTTRTPNRIKIYYYNLIYATGWERIYNERKKVETLEKEKIIQKLKIKDYNEELEEILDTKTFSKDVKNLLSSMLYKVENSYEDYKKTKVEVELKKELLEEIIEIIRKRLQKNRNSKTKIRRRKPNIKREKKHCYKRKTKNNNISKRTSTFRSNLWNKHKKI